MTQLAAVALLTVIWAAPAAAQVTPTLEDKLHSAVVNKWYVKVIEQDSTIIEGRAQSLESRQLQVANHTLDIASVARFERRVDKSGGARTGAIIGAVGLAVLGAALTNQVTPTGRNREALPTMGAAIVCGALIGLLLGETISPRNYEWQPQ